MSNLEARPNPAPQAEVNLKIATYNLRAGGKKGQRVHWQKLLDEVKADILLLQETRGAAEYLSAEMVEAEAQQIVWQPIKNHWGSAIFSRQGRLQPIQLPSFAGWVAGAEITGLTWPLLMGRSLKIFSVHVPPIKGNYFKSVHAILDEIALIQADSVLFIGGDFNVLTSFRHEQEERRATQHNVKLLTRLRKEFGLISCWQAAHPNRILAQTLRWSGNPVTPYHCDGLFMPVAWYQYLDWCEVFAGEWEALSDHNPVVAMFEF